MTEHWSSDDLEADADAKASGQRLSDQVDAFNRSVCVNAAQRIDALYNARTPEGTQQQAPNASQDQGLCTQANGDSQAGPAQNGPDATVSSGNAPGGAGSALDMSNERDRGLVRRSLANRPKRWAGVTDEVKAAVVAGLSKALHTATVHIDNGVDPLDAAKVVASVGRTFEALEAQCQKDEHRAEDQDRMDNGKPTGAIKLYGQDAPATSV